MIEPKKLAGTIYSDFIKKGDWDLLAISDLRLNGGAISGMHEQSKDSILSDVMVNQGYDGSQKIEFLLYLYGLTKDPDIKHIAEANIPNNAHEIEGSELRGMIASLKGGPEKLVSTQDYKRLFLNKFGNEELAILEKIITGDSFGFNSSSSSSPSSTSTTSDNKLFKDTILKEELISNILSVVGINADISSLYQKLDDNLINKVDPTMVISKSFIDEIELLKPESKENFKNILGAINPALPFDEKEKGSTKHNNLVKFSIFSPSQASEPKEYSNIRDLVTQLAVRTSAKSFPK